MQPPDDTARVPVVFAQFDILCSVLSQLPGPARHMVEKRLVSKQWLRATTTDTVLHRWRLQRDFLKWEIAVGLFYPSAPVFNLHRLHGAVMHILRGYEMGHSASFGALEIMAFRLEQLVTMALHMPPAPAARVAPAAPASISRGRMGDALLDGGLLMNPHDDEMLFADESDSEWEPASDSGSEGERDYEDDQRPVETWNDDYDEDDMLIQDSHRAHRQWGHNELHNALVNLHVAYDSQETGPTLWEFAFSEARFLMKRKGLMLARDPVKQQTPIMALWAQTVVDGSFWDLVQQFTVESLAAGVPVNDTDRLGFSLIDYAARNSFLQPPAPKTLPHWGPPPLRARFDDMMHVLVNTHNAALTPFLVRCFPHVTLQHDCSAMVSRDRALLAALSAELQPAAFSMYGADLLMLSSDTLVANGALFKDFPPLLSDAEARVLAERAGVAYTPQLGADIALTCWTALERMVPQVLAVSQHLWRRVITASDVLEADVLRLFVPRLLGYDDASVSDQDYHEEFDDEDGDGVASMQQSNDGLAVCRDQ